MATTPTNPVQPTPAVPLPAPPTLSDPDNFDERGDAFVAALSPMQQAINALADNAYTNALVIFGKAESAAQSANTASTQASQAMGYRNEAGGYATTALAARDQAQGFAVAVASSLTAVDERLLGGRALPPTTNNQGGPIAPGAMYVNTGTNPALKDRWYFWNGAEWKLGPGDFAGAYLPLSGGTMAGPLKVRPNATGEEAPQAQEVVQKNGPFNQGGELMSSAVFGQWASYAAANKAGMGADWPFRNLIADTPIHWNAFTFGASTRSTQIASQAFAIPGISGDFVIRTKHDAGWSLWSRILTDTTLVEREKTANVPAGTTTYDVNPQEGSVHYVVINGTVTFNLPAQGRQLGDQVTLRIYSNGGVRAVTFSSNVMLPFGQAFPTYAANQILTLVFFYGRQNIWDCFFGGVHQG